MFKKISLKAYMTLLWLSITTLSFILIVFTMREVNKASLEQIQQTLHQNIAAQIQQKIDTMLLNSESVLQFNQQEIKELLSNPNQLTELNEAFYNQIIAFEYIDGIFFGNTAGLFTGYSRIGVNDIQLMQVTPASAGAIEFYETDAAGQPTLLATRRAGFNTTQRPWFLDALDADKPVWGKLFTYHAYQRFALPLSSKVYDHDNTLIGVFGINLFVDFIDEMLNQLLTAPDDRIVILDSAGNIISYSGTQTVTSTEQHFSNDRFLSRVAQGYLTLANMPLNQATTTQYFEIDYDQQAFSISINSIDFDEGYHWVVINAFNNDSYLQTLKKSHNEAIFGLGLLFLLAAFLFTLAMQRFVGIIKKLISHINQLEVVNKNGQLMLKTHPVATLSRVIELRHIQQAFQKLSQRLTESLAEQNSNNEEINRLATVVQTASDMVVLCNKHGLIEWVNASFERVTGYSLAVCKGQHPGRLLQGEKTDPYVVNQISEAFKQKRFFQGRILNYRIDGAPYWVELSIHTVFDEHGEVKEYFSLQRDITQQVNFENELSIWKQIFHGARWGIAISRGESGMLGEHNPHFAYMLGYKLGELKGKNLRDIYAPEEHKKIPRFIKRIAQEGFVSFESVMQRKDGTHLPVLVNVSQVNNQDGSQSFRVANMQDLSEVKALEKQLRESNKMESLGNLTRGIVHDFNNILASTIVNAEMCQLLLEKTAKKHNSQIDTALSNIVNASERAAELINQILLFSRSEVAEKSNVSLVKVIDGVVTLMSANLAEMIHLKVVNQTGDGVLNVKGNRSQLHQLFLNLLSNGADAIKQLNKQNGQLQIKLVIVDHTDYFALSNFDFWIKVSVIDNGCGISEEVMQNMFEPLFTTKEEGKGTGLGLSLVQNIVQNHQGFVRCESQIDKGSEFIVYLPYERFNNVELDTYSASDKKQLNNTTGLTVLVDDNADFLLTLGQLLERQQLHNKCFTSAMMAAEFFKRHSQDIDLAFIDYAMPELNGIELASMLRDLNPAAFIVLVSGAYPEGYSKALDNGIINGFIMKPVSFNRVLAAVEESIALKKQRAAPDDKPSTD